MFGKTVYELSSRQTGGFDENGYLPASFPGMHIQVASSDTVDALWKTCWGPIQAGFISLFGKRIYIITIISICIW